MITGTWASTENRLRIIVSSKRFWTTFGSRSHVAKLHKDINLLDMKQTSTLINALL